MNKLARRANCVISTYPDARRFAACTHGLVAVYFIGGGHNGQRWEIPMMPLSKRLTIGDEQYRLRIFKESSVPFFMYPFYVYQSLH